MPAVRLHQFAAAESVESASPFCAKVHRALAFKGIEFEPVDIGSPGALRRLNPGVLKVPVLEWDGELVADSSRILRFLDEKQPDNPLLPKDPAARARAILFEDWADEALYWFAVYSRWAIDSNFEPFARSAFGSMPFFLRWFVPKLIRRDVLKQLHGQGIGRLPPSEVLERFEAHLDMLEGLLEEGPFLVGSDVTCADITLFSMLRPLTLPAAPESAPLVRPRATLIDYLSRVDARTRGEHTVPFE